MKKLIGIVIGAICIIIGALFLVNSYKVTDKTKEKFKKKLTGSYSNKVTHHTATGISFVVVGAVILVYSLLKKKRSKK